MHPFTDTTGQTWMLILDAPALERVRLATGLDLQTYTSGITPDADGVAIAKRIIHAVCEPQAQALGVDQETFIGGLGVEALEALAAAIGEHTNG